jgi:hypothetical protein
MESDQCNKKNIAKEEISNSIVNIGNVLQPSWIRCPICTYDEMDRIVLDYGYHLLRPIAIIFWVILLIASTI